MIAGSEQTKRPAGFVILVRCNLAVPLAYGPDRVTDDEVLAWLDTRLSRAGLASLDQLEPALVAPWAQACALDLADSGG